MVMLKMIILKVHFILMVLLGKLDYHYMVGSMKIVIVMILHDKEQNMSYGYILT